MWESHRSKRPGNLLIDTIVMALCQWSGLPVGTAHAARAGGWRGPGRREVRAATGPAQDCRI
jgi:hypothetical protein